MINTEVYDQQMAMQGSSEKDENEEREKNRIHSPKHIPIIKEEVDFKLPGTSASPRP